MCNESTGCLSTDGNSKMEIFWVTPFNKKMTDGINI